MMKRLIFVILAGFIQQAGFVNASNGMPAQRMFKKNPRSLITELERRKKQCEAYIASCKARRQAEFDKRRPGLAEIKKQLVRERLYSYSEVYRDLQNQYNAILAQLDTAEKYYIRQLQALKAYSDTLNKDPDFSYEVAYLDNLSAYNTFVREKELERFSLHELIGSMEKGFEL